ncbi:MAG: ATP-binding protein [Anaerolineales bacterium]|nr:ATP-binding protein [Anaerolineales bacterium]
MAKHELLLLVLDPSPILQLMERALHAAGYEIAIVHDQGGLKKSLLESTPALILIGETFDGASGVELAGGMLARFPTLPILLYAEKDTIGIVKAVLAAGLSGYIYPPLKMDTIVDAVKKSLDRASHLGDWIRREVKKTTSSLAERAKLSETERAKLSAIFSTIQDGVVVLDEGKHILFVNHAICEAFKVKEGSIIGRPIEDAIPHPELKSLLLRSQDGPLKYHEINFDEGQVFNAQFSPIPGVGSAITMQDISYLKELDRLKTDFVQTVSHDLRSPLTAVLSYTELMTRAGALNPQQQDFLGKIQSSVQHITTLVNDLLDLGRVEAGFDTRRERVDFENVLKYTLDTFDAEIKKRKINLVVKVAENLPPLRANPIRIRQMLDNLIGNAIKYVPEAGMVFVGIYQEGQQIILEVKDSGPGIPPNEQSRIFDKFYRASNVPDSAIGSGLGLAIVKSIVENHQGRVWVESDLDEGTSFFVILPVYEQSA